MLTPLVNSLPNETLPSDLSSDFHLADLLLNRRLASQIRSKNSDLHTSCQQKKISKPLRTRMAIFEDSHPSFVIGFLENREPSFQLRMIAMYVSLCIPGFLRERTSCRSVTITIESITEHSSDKPTGPLHQLGMSLGEPHSHCSHAQGTRGYHRISRDGLCHVSRRLGLQWPQRNSRKGSFLRVYPSSSIIRESRARL